VTVVVLTEVAILDFGADDARAEVPDETCNLGVDVPLAGWEPGACWMSLPCSAIKAVPSLANSFLSCGTILDRTRSLTGAFLFASL